jgi:hypothetical protein
MRKVPVTGALASAVDAGARLRVSDAERAAADSRTGRAIPSPFLSLGRLGQGFDSVDHAHDAIERVDLRFHSSLSKS